MFVFILFSTAQASSLGPTHIPTPAPPIDIGLSCDSLTLSVCLNEGGVLKIYFYDTRAFSNKVCSSLVEVVSISVVQRLHTLSLLLYIVVINTLFYVHSTCIALRGNLYYHFATLRSQLIKVTT